MDRRKFVGAAVGGGKEEGCRLGLVERSNMHFYIWLTLFIMYFSILGGVCFLGFFNLSTPSLAKTDFYGTKTRKLHFWHFKVPKSKIYAHFLFSNF